MLRKRFTKNLMLLLAVCIFALPGTALAETGGDAIVVSGVLTGQPAAGPAPSGTEGAAASVQPSASAQTEFDDSRFCEDMTGILLDADTGEVLYAKNPDQIIYPASTTKIMTGLLAIEMNGNTLDGEITLGPEVNEFSSSSSLMGLKQNHTVSIKDLVYGLMMCSGNDAAAALAVHFSGSTDAFVQKMNEKALELGMTNTHFSNPHGLDMRSLGQDHHSTAADMAKLALAAYRNPLLMEIMGTPSYTVSSTDLDGNIRESPVLYNGNYLIATPEKEPQRSRYANYLYEPATGMKTGLLQNIEGNEYYGCLVASAQKDGTNLIAAIFADTSDYGEDGPALDRWDAVTELFEYGFGRFVKIDLSPYLLPFSGTEQVSGYAENDPEAGMLRVTSGPVQQPPGTVKVKKEIAEGLADGSVQVTATPQITGPLSAPVMRGEEVGTVTYSLNGEELCTAALFADRSVYPAGEEQSTREEYGLPGLAFQVWWLWIIVPAAAVGALFLIRAVNLYRRRRSRRYGYRSRYAAGAGGRGPGPSRSSRADRSLVKTPGGRASNGPSRADRTRRKL